MSEELVTLKTRVFLCCSGLEAHFIFSRADLTSGLEMALEGKCDGGGERVLATEDMRVGRGRAHLLPVSFFGTGGCAMTRRETLLCLDVAKDRDDDAERTADNN